MKGVVDRESRNQNRVHNRLNQQLALQDEALSRQERMSLAARIPRNGRIEMPKKRQDAHQGKHQRAQPDSKEQELQRLSGFSGETTVRGSSGDSPSACFHELNLGPSAHLGALVRNGGPYLSCGQGKLAKSQDPCFENRRGIADVFSKKLAARLRLGAAQG